ncbi:MAG: Cobalt-zinc-cadmium resistance protein CzcA; Cation efflux system protein CusA, partial [uncultured Chloroflexi bacterium]
DEHATAGRAADDRRYRAARGAPGRKRPRHRAHTPVARRGHLRPRFGRRRPAGARLRAHCRMRRPCCSGAVVPAPRRPRAHRPRCAGCRHGRCDGLNL